MLRRGAIPKQYEILGTRELTREDLQILVEEPRARVSDVKSFRDSHHRIARLFAAGLRLQEVHARSGYSYVRLTTLYGDPAFQELIAQYREVVKESFKEEVDEYHRLATGNMLKAERMIADKLDKADEEDDLLPTKDLIAISRDAADRFGYGKKQTNLNVNVDFAAQLEKAIRRSGVQLPTGPAPKVIEHQPTTQEPLRRRA